MTEAGQPRIEVSVIICVRNGARVIRRQLQALDDQREHPPFEIIVCDNGSTDDTVEVVRRWMDSDTHAAVHTMLVHADERASIPYARNVALRAARGPLVAFCDADDQVAPGWVGAFARSTPDYGMAGGHILGQDPDGTPRPDAFPAGLSDHGYLPYAANCNLAASRQLLLDLDGYDESLPRYGFEDVDLSWRVQLSGRPLVYVPDAVVHMTLSPSHVALRKKLLLGKGRVLMAHRYPAYDSRCYTVMSCLRDVATMIWHTAMAAVRGPRPMLKKSASGSVASVGRLWGVLAYRVFGGYPPPRLLPGAGGRDSSASAEER